MRGMLAGLIASLLAFGFAKVYGEPQVDRAIAFEEHVSHAAAGAAEVHEHAHEIVSREVQATIGLLTGVVVYGTALGGLFALAFAFVNGRLVRMTPRATAVLLAGSRFSRSLYCPVSKVSGESSIRRSARDDRLSHTALFRDDRLFAGCTGYCDRGGTAALC